MPQPQPSQIPGSSGTSSITRVLKAPPAHSALLPSLFSAANCSSDHSYPYILPSQLPSRDLAARVDAICSPFISQHPQRQPGGRGDRGKQTPNCTHAKSVGSPCLSQDCLWHSQGRQPKETRQQHHAVSALPPSPGTTNRLCIPCSDMFWVLLSGHIQPCPQHPPANPGSSAPTAAPSLPNPGTAPQGGQRGQELQPLLAMLPS